MRETHGPHGAARWVTIESGAVPPWPPLRVALLRDARRDADSILLERPVVARDALGDPVFALTLLLERAPRADEASIVPLVAGATLALDLQLSVPPAVRDVLSRGEARALQPLFVRGGEIALETARDTAPARLCNATWSGTTLRAGLAATLRRDEALEVLRALEGAEGDLLCVRHAATFHGVAAELPIEVSGYYAELHDVMAACFGTREPLQAGELEQAFGAALARGLVDVTSTGGAALAAPPTSAAFRGFLRIASPLLERLGEGYRLRRERPHPAMRFEYRETAHEGEEHRVAGDTPLWQLLGGLLDGRPRDAYVRLALPDGAPPRRVRSRPMQRHAADRTRMAVQGETAVSMTTALRATVQPVAAGKLAHTSLARIESQHPGALGRINLYSLDDVVAEGNAAPARLPIVENAQAPLWRDRVETKRYWYAPALAPVLPAGNADPTASPFLFSLRRVGTGAAGEAALEGSVRISVRMSMPEAARKALAAAAGDGATPLPLGNLSASLSVPYLDAQSNAPRRATFQGSVTRAGDMLTATFALLNSSLRMAYGALSGVEPQAEPARLEIAYTYAGYVPAERTKLDAAFDGKRSIVSIPGSRPDAMRDGSRGYAEGGAAVFEIPGGEVRFRREAPQATRASRPPMAAVMHAGGATAVAVAAPIASATIRPQAILAQPAIARPPLAATGALSELLRKVKYVRRTLLRQESLDLALPCTTLGAFYREEREGLSEAIGCTQAIRLGQAVVRQYQDVPALATAAYRVQRSLQQPGRFLVIPAAYRITRYSPSIPGKGWRPAVAAFTVLDPDVDANNRILFQATLQPDIALHARRELADKLAALARDPVIEFPTEIAADVDYAWLVGAASHVEVETLKLADSFQVSLASDLAGALMLKTMIQGTGVGGTATFRLADGTSLSTVLAFELGTIVGPWTTGPLEIAAAGTSATLRNAIERPVDVAELLAYARTGSPQRVAVDATLQPGETRTVQIPAGSVELYAVATPAAGSAAAIEEIRSFVEEVATNAVFIDLVNRDNHGLLRLDIEARMKDVPGAARPVAMAGDPPSGSLDFLLPITTYLAKHVLQFRVRKTFRPAAGAAAESRFTRWFDWDLETAGAVVSLTWDLLGEGD